MKGNREREVTQADCDAEEQAGIEPETKIIHAFHVVVVEACGSHSFMHF